MPKNSLFTWCLGLALILRVTLIFNPGFEADISFWKSWGLATRDFGIVEGMKVTNNNYPTPFAYVLGAMVYIYSVFRDPHNFSEFWNNHNLLFLAIAKILPILADIGIAVLFLLIGKNPKRFGFPDHQHKIWGLTLYELSAIVYLASPISILDGAWWGQVDSVGVVLLLCAVLAALGGKPMLSGAIYMIAMMTKLQNMIYGPLFFLFLWQIFGMRGLVRAISGALITFAALNIEFILTKNMDRVIASLTENYDYFPWMSLNAYNLWWIVTKGMGLVTSDKLLVLGIANAKVIGLAIFSSLYLFATLKQLMLSIGGSGYNLLSTVISRTKKTLHASGDLTGAHKLRPDQSTPFLQSLIENLIIVNCAFFLFQTQSHDRYAFPLSVFLLLWIPFYLARYSNTANWRSHLKVFGVFYLLYTVFYFYNMHTALAAYYPQNSIPILNTLTSPIFTVPTAFFLIGLFGVYIATILKYETQSRFLLGVCVVVCIVLMSLPNRAYLAKSPIRLTQLSPYISEQGYGTRQTNRAVNSGTGGPERWTRLSVQYVFYRYGIGTHANSKIVYDIGGKFREFTTDYGIDTSAGDKASALFEIYGDGKLLFRSEKMGRYDMPRHAKVPISGVQKLMLVTTDAGDDKFDDHTDWLNPTLWP